MPSPHDILRIGNDADEEEIERAYRQRVKEVHPDRGGTTEEFKLVKQAYDQLTDGETTDESQRDDSSMTAQPRVARVSYLNYDVISDHEWSITDDDLFEKARQKDIDTRDCGRMVVKEGETILEAAEKCGFEWPFACRGGACANCAVLIVEGEVDIRYSSILPEEMRHEGFRLSCIGIPITGDVKLIYNIKHLPKLDELRLPPLPFRKRYGRDPAD